MTELPVAYLSDRTGEFDLWGPGGNTFAIAAVGKSWLRQLGESTEVQKQFSSEIFGGDYENVLSTMDKWFDLDLLDCYEFDKLGRDS